MINTLSILIGLFGVILVVVRATVMDKALPWFKPVPPVKVKPKFGTMNRR